MLCVVLIKRSDFYAFFFIATIINIKVLINTIEDVVIVVRRVESKRI